MRQIKARAAKLLLEDNRDTSFDRKLHAKLVFSSEEQDFRPSGTSRGVSLYCVSRNRACAAPESSKRVLHGEAVFCYELGRFGVNTTVPSVRAAVIVAAKADMGICLW